MPSNPFLEGTQGVVFSAAIRKQERYRWVQLTRAADLGDPIARKRLQQYIPG